jgi:hypothetical protein
VFYCQLYWIKRETRKSSASSAFLCPLKKTEMCACSVTCTGACYKIHRRATKRKTKWEKFTYFCIFAFENLTKMGLIFSRWRVRNPLFITLAKILKILYFYTNKSNLRCSSSAAIKPNYSCHTQHCAMYFYSFYLKMSIEKRDIKWNPWDTTKGIYINNSVFVFTLSIFISFLSWNIF